MRKILSVILALTMIISIIGTIPFAISAEEGNNTNSGSIINNYDESGVVYENSEISGWQTSTNRTYKDNTVLLSYGDASVENAVALGNDSYAIHFSNGHSNGDKGNGNEFPNQVKIYDSSSEDLGFFTPKANTPYKISLKYYSLDGNYANNKNLKLRVARAHETTDKAVAEYYGDIVQISENTNGWVEKELVFSTGSEVTPLVVALQTYNNQWWGDANVWVDDITVTEMSLANTSTTDFDGEQYTYFTTASNKLDTSDRFAITDIGDGNYAAKFTRISSGAGNNGGWQANYANAFYVYDSNNNNRAYLNAEQIYKITVDVKRVVNNASFHIGLLMDANLYTSNSFASFCLNDFKSAGKLVEIQNFATVGTDVDFVTYTAYVKAPLSGAAAIVMYNDGINRNDGQEIYVDNLTVTPIKKQNLESSTVTFDNEQYGFFVNSSNSLNSTGEFSIVDLDDSDAVNNAARYTRYLSGTADWSGWEAKGADGFYIYDTNTSYKAILEEGTRYKISIDVKRVTSTTTFHIGLWMNNSLYTSNSISGISILDEKNAGNVVELCKFSTAGTDEDFVTYTAYVKAPLSSAAAIVMYNDTGNRTINQEVYVDNLVIEKAPLTEVTSVDTIVDFESDNAKGFYKEYSSSDTNYGTTSDVAAIKDIGDANHGTVMQFNKMKVYRADGYNGTPSIYAPPSAFALTDSTGTSSVVYKKGEILNVTFEMKKNSAISNDYFNEFVAALVFGSNVTTSDMGSVNNYVNNNQYVALATVDNAADSDWVTYNATVTVPCDGTAAFMLFGKDWHVVCDIYVDNITITHPTETVVDFEDTQADFYANNPYGTGTGSAAVKTTDKGNVIHFSQLRFYKKWNHDVNSQWPSIVALTNNDGTGYMYYEKGDVLTVTFKMKKNAAVPTTYFDEFYACMVFDNSGMVKTTNAGSVASLVDNGKVVKIATIDCNADTNWVTYTANITVPVSGFGAFLLYGEQWVVTCDIDVDDITVKEYDGSLEVRTGDINGDTKVDIRDLVAIKKMAVYLMEPKISADLNENGVIADASDVTIMRQILLGVIDFPSQKKNNLELVWHDEFTTSSLNTKDKWEFVDTMPGTLTVYDNAKCATVDSGELNLTAYYNESEDKYYTSKGITTKNKMYFKYGYIEMRAKVPFTQGAWPSFWLLMNTPYQTHEWFGEIDIFEVFSNKDTLAHQIHRWGSKGHDQYYTGNWIQNLLTEQSYTFANSENLKNEYHTYGLEWTEDYMKFSVDGVVYETIKLSSFKNGVYSGKEGLDQFAYIIINNELFVPGGENTTDAKKISPTDDMPEYTIDYIRLYQNKDTDDIIYVK